MKIDPYKHKEKYENWRKEVDKSGIPEISKYNSDLILRYLNDMGWGYNVSNVSAKGSRSYIRLNTIRSEMIFFAKRFKIVYKIDNITEINELQLCKFFNLSIIGTKSESEAIKMTFFILGCSIGKYIKSIVSKVSTPFCLNLNFPSIFNL
jgi:hypothetical protein